MEGGDRLHTLRTHENIVTYFKFSLWEIACLFCVTFFSSCAFVYQMCISLCKSFIVAFHSSLLPLVDSISSAGTCKRRKWGVWAQAGRLEKIILLYS